MNWPNWSASLPRSKANVAVRSIGRAGGLNLQKIGFAQQFVDDRVPAGVLVGLQRRRERFLPGNLLSVVGGRQVGNIKLPVPS